MGSTRNYCSSCGKTASSCGCNEPKSHDLCTPGKPLLISWNDYMMERDGISCKCLPVGVMFCVVDLENVGDPQNGIKGDGKAPCPGIYLRSDPCKGHDVDLQLKREHFEGEDSPFVWNDEECRYDLRLDCVTVDSYDDKNCQPLKPLAYLPKAGGEGSIVVVDKPPLPVGKFFLVKSIGDTLKTVHDGQNFVEIFDNTDGGQRVIYKILTAKAVFKASDYCLLSIAGNKVRFDAQTNIGYFINAAQVAQENTESVIAGGQFATRLKINGNVIQERKDYFGCNQSGNNSGHTTNLSKIWTTDGDDIVMEVDLLWGVATATGDPLTTLGGMEIGDSFNMDMSEMIGELIDARDEIKVTTEVTYGPTSS